MLKLRSDRRLIISIFQFRYLITSKFTSLGSGRILDLSLAGVPLTSVLGFYVLCESETTKCIEILYAYM